MCQLQGCKQMKILFIINPNSGVGKYKKIENELGKFKEEHSLNYSVRYTEYAGHAKLIAKEESGNFEVIVAVGGDGSINEVGQGLIGSKATMGIIPTGSGNGLARFLGIPININKAINTILLGNTRYIDAVRINQEYFFNVAGVGFDAHIGHLFGQLGTRGLMSYIKLVLREFFNYKPQVYNIIVDGIEHTKKAFVLSFANSSQYGNNAHISPLSKIDDGKIELCIIKPFKKIYSPLIGIALFVRRIHKFSFVEIISAQSIVLKNDKLLEYHIDGEPKTTENDLNLEVISKGLKVIAP